jgi:hypothetical protein
MRVFLSREVWEPSMDGMVPASDMLVLYICRVGMWGQESARKRKATKEAGRRKGGSRSVGVSKLAMERRLIFCAEAWYKGFERTSWCVVVVCRERG